MTTEHRQLMTTYYACRRAMERVDQLRQRKTGSDFSATLHMERQSYVDLANEVAEEVEGLETVQ